MKKNQEQKNNLKMENQQIELKSEKARNDLLDFLLELVIEVEAEEKIKNGDKFEFRENEK